MDILRGADLKNQEVEFLQIFLFCLKTVTESSCGKYQLWKKSVEKVTRLTSHEHAQLWQLDYNLNYNMDYAKSFQYN